MCGEQLIPPPGAGRHRRAPEERVSYREVLVGFVTGAAVVATVGSYRTLGIDAVTFRISALILLIAVRTRGKRPTMWLVSADGIRIVFGDGILRAADRLRVEPTAGGDADPVACR